MVKANRSVAPEIARVSDFAAFSFTRETRNTTRAPAIGRNIIAESKPAKITYLPRKTTASTMTNTPNAKTSRYC